MPSEAPPGPARHYRVLDLPRLADRLWRVPLVLAAVVFAACGPAHALGNTDLVYYGALVGLALSAFAVPLGLLGLRARPPSDRTDSDTRRNAP
ncbi:hypothetical protein ACIBSW_38520 [Actinoplanes sp. NPDC049668]|uniref:hypothetical protein n=1 Tax=unclassified Actinoplanes TaxID=2626549 RepID=UPI0033B4143E